MPPSVAPLPRLHVVRAGQGAPVVLVHGSATDHLTWSIQLASPLTQQHRLIAYDRRGSGLSAAAATDAAPSIEQHAADLAELVVAEGAPVVAVGSSFGAVVVLELARRFPAWLRGAVLCEPPLPHVDDADEAPAPTAAFVAELDRIAAADGADAAAERFLRAVLGDAAYERMPRRFQERSKATWPAIRADCAALAAYRPRYAQLAGVRIPVLLLGGERSAPYFRPTLDALAAALGQARLEMLPGAGHMMHAEAARRFNERLATFCTEVGHG